MSEILPVHAQKPDCPVDINLAPGEDSFRQAVAGVQADCFRERYGIPGRLSDLVQNSVQKYVGACELLGTHSDVDRALRIRPAVDPDLIKAIYECLANRFTDLIIPFQYELLLDGGSQEAILRAEWLKWLLKKLESLPQSDGFVRNLCTVVALPHSDPERIAAEEWLWNYLGTLEYEDRWHYRP